MILTAIVRGEFNINGFKNKNLQKLLGFNGAKISRLIKRLRVHGLIKKATDAYKILPHKNRERNHRYGSENQRAGFGSDILLLNIMPKNTSI